MRGDDDRSAHPAGRRRDGRVLQQARRHDRGARYPRPSDRRPFDPGVRAASGRGTIPDDLRTPGGAAACGLAGPGPRADAALHRRARDVRPAPPRSVAVDASPVARSGQRRDGSGRNVPVSRRGEGQWRSLMSESVSRLVLRAPNWLGDAVLALPAMAALRRHFASAYLAVAGPPGVAAIFREETDVKPDSVIEISDRNRE